MAGSVKYSNSISAQANECPDIWHKTIWWWGSSNAGPLGNTKYPFITIASWSTLPRSEAPDRVLSKRSNKFCYVLTFDPAEKNAIPRWCTGRKWHIPMAVRRGNRVGGYWLMKWDKVIPMVHYRVMHRKRVTSELHDCYFRLMTIKHSISKIEWASNDYIIQLSSTRQAVARRVPDSWRRGVVGKATPDQGGPRKPRWWCW